MLFRKNIEKSCVYCAYGTPQNEDEVLCARKGNTPAEKPCWWFRYDPCKRIPAKAKAMDFKKYDDEDYSL